MKNIEKHINVGRKQNWRECKELTVINQQKITVSEY